MPVPYSIEELAALERDADRFRAEQERAWGGWPEYTVYSFYSEFNRSPEREEFLEARARWIDSHTPR